MAGSGSAVRRRPPWARRLLSRRVEVSETSMMPALRPGDRLLVDVRAYRTDDPQVGDIVLCENPEGLPRWLLKRVAPAPGPLPPGRFWLLGDARGASRDSRTFGPVARERIAGRAWFRYAPAERRGLIEPAGAGGP